MKFRFLDLLVTLGVAASLLGVTIAARQQAQETSVMAECANNLRLIAQSLAMYQGLHDGAFPRTRYDPAAPLTAYTGAAASDPFSTNGPASNDVTAAAFLLAREMELPARTFVCPAALRHGLAEGDSFDRTTARERSNFRARLNYNYSLANMYPDEAAVRAGYSLDHFVRRLPKTFVIAGDTNPGGVARSPIDPTQPSTQNAMRMHNSPNHQRNGQNLLFADASVRYYGSPLKAAGEDAVYASQATFPQPANAADVVLVPTWDEGPDLTSTNVLIRRWSLVGAVAFAVIVIGGVVWRGLKRRSPAPAAASA